MEKPIKMDDLGVPPIFGNTHMKNFLTSLLEETSLKVDGPRQ